MGKKLFNVYFYCKKRFHTSVLKFLPKKHTQKNKKKTTGLVAQNLYWTGTFFYRTKIMRRKPQNTTKSVPKVNMMVQQVTLLPSSLQSLFSTHAKQSIM